MQHIVTGLFDTQSEAEVARDQLIRAGIPDTQIRIIPGGEVTADASSQRARAGDQGGFWASLKELFMPDEDRQSYAEGLRRGGVMLTVRAEDSSLRSVENLLENAGAVDMHERESSWRAEGWAASDLTATEDAPKVVPTELPATTGAPRGRESASTREDTIPIVEEQLKVGKRVASEGRVRVRTYVVDTPVRESVTLREDRVEIERRPANRPLEATERPFEERTIEAQAKREEPVVSKQTRVKEEVVVKKQPTERTETVADTVRRTEVQVERQDEPGRSVPSTK